jgi:hypothetical protein
LIVTIPSATDRRRGREPTCWGGMTTLWSYLNFEYSQTVMAELGRTTSAAPALTSCCEWLGSSTRTLISSHVVDVDRGAGRFHIEIDRIATL